MVTYHGSQIKVAVKTSAPAYTDWAPTTDVTFSFDRDVLEIYKHGDPAPQELKTGHYKITGTITRDFTTGNFSASGTTFFGMATGMTDMFIGLFPNGDASITFLVSNVKFSHYEVKGPLKDRVQESVQFEGLLFSLA